MSASSTCSILKSGKKRESGFTLVEVMMAMFVISLLSAGVFASVYQIRHQAEVARCRSVATAIMNERLEEMRATTFDNLSTSLASSSYTEGSVTLDHYTYNWERIPTSSTNAYSVQVVVSWKVREREYRISALSFISKYGVILKTSS